MSTAMLVAVAALTLSPAVRASTQVLAAIKLNPVSGPPTTPIKMSGKNFGSFEVVDVAFDGAILAKPTTQGSGRFTARFAVSASASPGDHQVTATGEESGLVATAVFVVQTNWVQFHFSPDLSGLNPYENILNPSNVAGLTQSWSSVLSGAVQASPAVVEGIVFTGTSDGHIYAIDAATGSVLWQRSTTAAVVHDPAVANGLVLFPTLLDHTLHAYDAETGMPVWEFRGDAGIESPTVSGGIAYFGDDLGSLYALDVSSGAMKWKAAVSGGMASAPAVDGGRVYAGTWNFLLYAFDAISGAPLWTATLGGAAIGSPAVADGIVYIGSGDGNVYALNALSGGLIWKHPTGGAIESSPSIANHVLYIGSDDHDVYALDAASGASLWVAQTGDIIQKGSPAIANGLVFIGSVDKSVYAFDAISGAVLWSYATRAGVTASPAVADGVLYVASFDRRMYAFHLP